MVIMQTVILNTVSSEVFLFLFFFLLILILDRKFNVTLPRKLFLNSNKLIFQRGCSILAYYVPYIELLTYHIPLIQETHPYLVRLFLPSFISDSMGWYQQVPFFSTIYMLFTYITFLRFKFPPDRFIRYNLMFGIFLMYMQGIYIEIYMYYVNNWCETVREKSDTTLSMLLIWLIVFFSAVLRALLGKYIENSFIRETIEMHLGRDGPDFVWWDREKKPKPKPPKK
uniref:hypothetical protein n=1 Tax=Dictyotopsis propagulifera TaxID=670095 RepID=UPI002E773AD7|nr:hypothetical protein V2485_pgp041 [Dictyotopsis propagulifera]WAM63216.1 hypothetical protein [Dictyotopsis propagulifera]